MKVRSYLSVTELTSISEGNRLLWDNDDNHHHNKGYFAT